MSEDLIAWLRGVLEEDEGRYRPLVEGWEPPEDGAAIEEWREARWRLADIAAKRAILDLHGWESHECPAPSDEWGPHTGYEPLCRTLRLLASAYAERPGYREEWAPDYLSSTEGKR